MKKIISITLLLFFFFSQYGKFISYVYCEWQAEAKTVTCDCEKRLIDGARQTSGHSAQLQLKDKSEEPCIKTELIDINLFSQQINSSFVNTVFLLANGFEYPLLHPPAIS